MSARDDLAGPRWLESSSDAPSDIRAAIADLAESGDDEALLARLENRLSPLFGASAGASELPTSRLQGTESASKAPPAGASASGLGLKVGGIFVLGVGAVALALGAQRVEPRATPSPRTETASSAHPLTSSAPPVSNPVPDAAPKVPTPSTSSASSVPVRRPVPRPSVAAGEQVSQMAEEARLLRSARESIGTSLGQALSLLAEHERRFPRGELREERELFAIDVLLRAGRTAEAIERLERLRKTSPGSPHLGAAERLVSKKNGGVR